MHLTYFDMQKGFSVICYLIGVSKSGLQHVISQKYRVRIKKICDTIVQISVTNC